MELNKIELLVEKYFQGESSIAEENELRTYFSSLHVAQHLGQYKPLFGYLSLAADQKFAPEIALDSKQDFQNEFKKRKVTWLSIAASVVILMGIGTYGYYNDEFEKGKQNLGTYDDPELAFRQTQKALALLSNHVNVGIESVKYIEEYQESKELIFKQ